MKQHGGKYFARIPSPPARPRAVGSKDLNSTFSECIKLNGITNAATWYQIFGPHPPPPSTLRWVERSKFNFFQHMAMMYIKFNGIANARRPPPPSPNPWIKIQHFSEQGHVAYQIKWNHECSNMVANI